MTRAGQARYPRWFPLARLAWVAAAGAGWYVRPDLGPWLVAAAALPWLVHALRTGQLWHRTPFDGPLLLFLVTAAASLAAAYDPQGAHPVFPAPMGWGKLWGLALALLVFNATAALETEAQRRTLVRLLACFGAAVAVYFMLTNNWDALPGSDPAVPPAFIPRLGRRIQAPFPTLPGHRLNRNVAGSLTALTLPMALALLGPTVGRRTARRSWAMLGLVLTAVIAIGVLLSHSRGAWLAAGAVLAFSAAWTLAGALTPPHRRRTAFLALVLLPTLAGGLAVAALPGLRARVLDGAAVSNRLALFSQGLLLVRDYPFTGFGLGQFPVVHSTYAELIHVPVLVFAHATPLDVALEQGLPAALALLGVWIGAAWMGLRALGAARRPAGLAAGLLSLAVLVVHGSVDSTIYGSRALLLLWLPIGLIVAAARQAESHPSPGSAPHARQPGSSSPPDPLGPPPATGPGISAPVPQQPPPGGGRPSAGKPRVSPAAAPEPRSGSPSPPGPSAHPSATAAGDPAAAPPPPSTRAASPSAIDHREYSAAGPPTTPRRRCWRLAAPAVAAATLALVLGALFWRPLAGAYHANLGAVHQTRVELRAYDWNRFGDPTLAEVRQQEDLSAAIDQFQRALAFDPGQPTARTRLSQIAHARRAYDDALTHAQAAWDAGHRDRITRLVLGDALVAHGRIDEAVAVVHGLDRAAMRLSGQAFYHYQRHGDHERAGWARQAAERVEEVEG